MGVMILALGAGDMGQVREGVSLSHAAWGMMTESNFVDVSEKVMHVITN